MGNLSESLALGTGIEHIGKCIIECQYAIAISGDPLGQAGGNHDVAPADTVTSHLLHLLWCQFGILHEFGNEGRGNRVFRILRSGLGQSLWAPEAQQARQQQNDAKMWPKFFLEHEIPHFSPK